MNFSGWRLGLAQTIIHLARSDKSDEAQSDHADALFDNLIEAAREIVKREMGDQRPETSMVGQDD